MSPSPEEAAAEKVRLLLDACRDEDAGRAAHEALRSDPNNARLLGLLALALNRTGHQDDARQWAESSLAIDPQQAWVHNIRARAILNGAGQAQEAVESAHTSVQLDHSEPAYRYTLTSAYLGVSDRANAQTTARSIRRIDPSSALGPLAEALVELDSVKFFEFEKKSDLFWIVAALIAVPCLFLPFLVVLCLTVFVRRARPLRRADQLLLEALRLDPINRTAHSFVADVAQLRFRYVRSVDASLATAALDAGLVKADDLARTIVRRTSIAAAGVAAVGIYCLIALAAFAPIHVTVFAGVMIGLSAVAAVYWFDRVQTRRLPRGLIRRVRRRWGLPTTLTVIAAYMIFVGSTDAEEPALAVVLLVPAFLVAVFAVTLFVKLYLVRRGR